MKILQTNFHGDPNIGLFGKSCDHFCLLSNFVKPRTVEKMKDALRANVIRTTLASTEFVGMFCCMNSNGILLPSIVNARELDVLASLKKEFDLNIIVLKTRFTALGNLLLCNDHGVIISKNLKDERKIIEDCLGVSGECLSIAGMDNVGSCGIATNSGCLVHRDANENEIKLIMDVLKARVEIGTANFGSPFVGGCIIANSSGALVGESSTGPEINRLMEALGYF